MTYYNRPQIHLSRTAPGTAKTSGASQIIVGGARQERRLPTSGVGGSSRQKMAVLELCDAVGDAAVQLSPKARAPRRNQPAAPSTPHISGDRRPLVASLLAGRITPEGSG